MDDVTKARILSNLRELGNQAVSDGLVEQVELDAAVAAAERGDGREGRGFFLLILCRETGVMGL